MIKGIVRELKSIYVKRNSKRYCEFLRKKGVKIGKGTHIASRTCFIDITRPSLVTIGDNC